MLGLVLFPHLFAYSLQFSLDCTPFRIAIHPSLVGTKNRFSVINGTAMFLYGGVVEVYIMFFLVWTALNKKQMASNNICIISNYKRSLLFQVTLNFHVQRVIFFIVVQVLPLPCYTCTVSHC